MMEMSAYPSLACLLEDLENYFNGRKMNIQVDISRYIEILADAIQFLYSRAARLGSDQPINDMETLMLLNICVGAIFDKLEEAEIQNYIAAGKLELELMMLMRGFHHKDCEETDDDDEDDGNISSSRNSYSYSASDLLSWPGVPQELVALLQTLPKFNDTEFFS